MNKNKELIDEFTAFCEGHPEMRFWQALRAWTGFDYIVAKNETGYAGQNTEEDTFYWEGKDR